MQNKSKRFSQHFGLKSPKDGFEFFDLDLYEDTKLFIDPYYLSQIKDSRYVSSINKTLKIFKPISEKIPYKFYYNMIKNNKDRTEFLKFGMER